MTVAVFQHGTGNLALFLHVLGATVLFGAVVVFVMLAAAGRRQDDAVPFARHAFRIWMFLVVPAYIVTRVGAQWILSLENNDIPKLDDKGWVSAGFLVTDIGIVILLALGITAWRGARKPEARGARTASLVLASVYLAALAVAWFAMSAKPGQ